MLDLSGPSLTPDERSFLSETKVGGVCYFRRNVRDRFQLAEFSEELRGIVGDDLLIATDQEGGSVVRVLDLPYPPGALALGAVADADLTRRVAAATARGLKATGINLDFAPVADVNSNPFNPVIAERAFGSRPHEVAEQVVAFVQGLQAEGVAATVKHFPGHGAAGVDSHLALPKLESSPEALEKLEFVPFRAALAAGVAAVMSAHIVVPGIDAEVPATFSSRILQGILREELGFDGMIFTDALNMQAVAARHRPGEAVLLALAAGVDMPVHVGPLSDHADIVRAVERACAEGRLDPEALRRSQIRRRRLVKRYPAGADAEAAWTGGDESLLETVAGRAVTVLGPFTPFESGMSVKLVTSEATRGGGASDGIASPVNFLAQALKEAGLNVEVLSYGPERLESEQSDLLARLRDQRVVFISTSRLRLSEAERKFAGDVVRLATGFVHLALWNPYSVGDLPGPAVISFGFRPVSLRAAAQVLLGQAATARAPVELKTA